MSSIHSVFFHRCYGIKRKLISFHPLVSASTSNEVVAACASVRDFSSASSSLVEDHTIRSRRAWVKLVLIQTNWHEKRLTASKYAARLNREFVVRSGNEEVKAFVVVIHVRVGSSSSSSTVLNVVGSSTACSSDLGGSVAGGSASSEACSCFEGILERRSVDEGSGKGERDWCQQEQNS
jgi:hypothetical protein